MKLLWYQIILTIISICLAYIDWKFYSRFKKLLKMPFKNINLNTKDLDPDFIITDTLYTSYKKLPPRKFKIVKMNAKSWSDNNSIQQIIDIFTKLVFTLLLTIMGVTITITVALLSFYNSNAELKKDQYSWITSVKHLLADFKNGMDAYQCVIFTGIILFLLASIRIFISTEKSKLIKQHLVIIEEIEKENS